MFFVSECPNTTDLGYFPAAFISESEEGEIEGLTDPVGVDRRLFLRRPVRGHFATT